MKEIKRLYYRLCYAIKYMFKDRPKLLIIGYKRSGKDTAAEFFRDWFGMTFKSSSEKALELFMFDILKERHGYKTMQEAIDHKNGSQEVRTEWFDLICEFNKEDPTRLFRAIIEDQDAYVGLRNMVEAKGAIQEGLIDHIIWIDAEDRVGVEDSSSCTVNQKIAGVIVKNNGTLEQFEDKLFILGKIIF